MCSVQSIYESSKVTPMSLLFPLKVQVPEKKLVSKSCIMSENYRKTTFKKLKHCSHKALMSHQALFVHHFLPNCTSPEEKFL